MPHLRRNTVKHIPECSKEGKHTYLKWIKRTHASVPHVLLINKHFSSTVIYHSQDASEWKSDFRLLENCSNEKLKLLNDLIRKDSEHFPWTEKQNL